MGQGPLHQDLGEKPNHFLMGQSKINLSWPNQTGKLSEEMLNTAHGNILLEPKYLSTQESFSPEGKQGIR